ncbi:MAG: hypothetical protein EBZ78_04680 [Verrucomicrobia bacterium]|nr:hypothetical protein [Verrucomicrobiota bacterium]
MSAYARGIREGERGSKAKSEIRNAESVLKGREENSPGRSPGKLGRKGGALKGRKSGSVFYDS